jgi:hypothetical protein
MHEAEDLLRAAEDEAARAFQARRLRLLLQRLSRSGTNANLMVESGYFEALCERMQAR